MVNRKTSVNKLVKISIFSYWFLKIKNCVYWTLVTSLNISRLLFNLLMTVIFPWYDRYLIFLAEHSPCAIIIYFNILKFVFYLFTAQSKTWFIPQHKSLNFRKVTINRIQFYLLLLVLGYFFLKSLQLLCLTFIADD